MARMIFEGIFKIPYQGQMRFSVEMYDGVLKFKNPERMYDSYFMEQRACVVYDYEFDPERNPDISKAETQHERRQGFLTEHSDQLKEFMMGTEDKLVLNPEFRGSLFGSYYEKEGELILHRLYKN